ncbi:MAG TPA: 3-deoxy-7-phosphoheptulonate synthase, partial [Gemmataceae bacterium]|nr:3-deoxy-7-phosphoheptulonate synthase [Gemmataceae bacterium]
MIIVVRPNSTREQINHILDRIAELGFKPHISQGEHRTIIGVIGDENKLQAEPLAAIPGVEQVLPIMKAFKLASRDFHAQDSVIEIGAPGRKRVRVGGGHLAMIAGPCAIEGAAVVDEIAAKVKAAGANILRGGAFKPRTSPYSFQGLGEDGLKILRDAGEKHDMPVVTEVMDPRQVELVEKWSDMFQI